MSDSLKNLVAGALTGEDKTNISFIVTMNSAVYFPANSGVSADAQGKVAALGAELLTEIRKQGEVAQVNTINVILVDRNVTEAFVGAGQPKETKSQGCNLSKHDMVLG